MKQIPWALAVLLLLGTTYWQWDRASGFKHDLKLANESLVLERAANEKLRASISKTVVKHQVSRVVIKEALDASPEYRDAPVPQPVIDGLCSVIRCKATSSVPASSR